MICRRKCNGMQRLKEHRAEAVGGEAHMWIARDRLILVALRGAFTKYWHLHFNKQLKTSMDPSLPYIPVKPVDSCACDRHVGCNKRAQMQ